MYGLSDECLESILGMNARGLERGDVTGHDDGRVDLFEREERPERARPRALLEAHSRA